MTQKDLATLKRRLKADKRGPSMIRGCYLTAKGEIVTTFRKSVGQMPAEELEYYFSIFRKAISGSYGQTLLPVSFSDEQVAGDDAYADLMGLCRTELEDENVAGSIYQRVASWIQKEKGVALQSVEEQKKAPNYLVLLLYDSFDVAYKHPDGEEDMEMSESVMNYVLCAVSPVQQGKEALTYFENEAAFHANPPQWTVTMPELGFLFPAFEQGGANVYQALYYTKDADNVHEDFLTDVFHSGIMMTASEQKETVASLLQNTLREECSMDVVQSVNDSVAEMITEQKEDKNAEPLTLSRKDVHRVLENAGVSDEKLEAFDKNFDEAFGEKTVIPAVNVVSHKEFKVTTPSVQIRVDPEHRDLVTTREIDGQKYILILADGEVEVNGICISL